MTLGDSSALNQVLQCTVYRYPVIGKPVELYSCKMLLSAEGLLSQGDLMTEVADGGDKLDVRLDVGDDVGEVVEVAGGGAEHAFIVTVTTSSIVVVSSEIGSLIKLQSLSHRAKT